MEDLDTGFIMDGIPSSLGAWDGSRPVNVTLPEGVTWDDINAISVWYVHFPHLAAGLVFLMIYFSSV